MDLGQNIWTYVLIALAIGTSIVANVWAAKSADAAARSAAAADEAVVQARRAADAAERLAEAQELANRHLGLDFPASSHWRLNALGDNVYELITDDDGAGKSTRTNSPSDG